jgi:hypothetical protein
VNIIKKYRPSGWTQKLEMAVFLEMTMTNPLNPS